MFFLFLGEVTTLDDEGKNVRDSCCNQLDKKTRRKRKWIYVL